MENKRERMTMERMTTTRSTTRTTTKTTRVQGVFVRVGRVGGKIKSLSRGKRLITEDWKAGDDTVKHTKHTVKEHTRAHMMKER